MHYTEDGFARFIGAAVKLAAPGAAVGTMGTAGEVTLPGGQVFEFTVRELKPAQAEGESAAPVNRLPPLGVPQGTRPAGRDAHGRRTGNAV